MIPAARALVVGVAFWMSWVWLVLGHTPLATGGVAPPMIPRPLDARSLVPSTLPADRNSP